MVAIPPTSVAKPIGMSTDAAEVDVRRQTPMRMGSSKTTIGVLLTNAESTAPTTRVARNETNGARPHIRPRNRPTGSSAPVRTIP